MSNKLNLLIDFNNIAMRSLFMCSYMRDSEVSDFSTDTEIGVFVRKVTMDISYIIRLFSPNRVIIACDSKDPWRNELFNDIEGETYKGNRTKDASKDWNKIFAAIKDMKRIFAERGMVVSEIPSAEADDIAALWKKKLYYENEENIVMVSSDKDWSQLVSSDNQSNAFCIVFNPISTNKGKKKLMVDKGFKEWIDSPSMVDIFFSNFSPYKDLVKRVQAQDSKVELSIVDPEEVLMEKIICGDDGDNIPGFYEYWKNGKKVRFTPLRMHKLLDSICANNMYMLQESANNGALKSGIEDIFGKKIEDLDAIERLMRQRKMVELDPDLFPEPILSDFNEHYTREEGNGGVSTLIKMEDLLKETRYIDENYSKPKVNSIFEDLKDLDRFFK